MTPPAAASTRALPRTTITPRAPRRVSGPARRSPRGEDARARTRTRGAASAEPFAVRALRRVRLLADSRLLDRLIRGRLWIPLVAAGLMGIVFMQVTMLKFNAGIGRAVTSAGTLEHQNANLRADISGMESGTRIDAVAHSMGMVVPADGSTNYVRANAADAQARAAAQRMTAADPGAVARTQAGEQLAQGQAAGVASTGSATAAPTPAQAQAQAAAQAATTPTSPATTAGATTGSTAAGTGTTGTTASTPPAATQQQPSQTAATGTGTTSGTGAATSSNGATTPTTQQQTPVQTAQAPVTQTQQTTSGGVVAPTPEG